jgi:DNA-binding CsgD family transcriptional regulator
VCPTDLATRAAQLEPAAYILPAAGDVAAATLAADELAHLATASDAPPVEALAARAEGAVRLAEGDARAALGRLRDSAVAWQRLGAPYDVARARVLSARACRALGDDASAALALEAAAATFDELGAAPDRAHVTALERGGGPALPGGLSPREIEVLRLVAGGATNKAIGAELTISEKTVARHVSNIFTKVGVSSRAAATAYAYEHGLSAERPIDPASGFG